MHEVDVTDHAVERYRERVRPGLSLDGCERELLHVLTLAEVRESAPPWAHGRQHYGMAMWVLLGDDIAFPLERTPAGGLVAVTCLTRLGCSEENLALRRAARAKRRRFRGLRRADESPRRSRGRAAA